MSMKASRNVSGVAILSLVLGLVGSLGLFAPAAFAATSPILVGSAPFSILGASTVTCTGPSTFSGNVGVTPGAAITGFPVPCTIGPGTLESNTPSAIAAQADNLAAFGALDAGTNADANCIGGVLPSGTDLTTLSPLGPGLYCSAGTFLLTGNLSLTGTTGTWVFKTVSGLTTSPGSSVTGGDACNTWWRVGSSAILDTTTQFRGNILALTDINFLTGADLVGRAMVQTGQVVLDTDDITACTPPVPPGGGGSSSFSGTINVVKTVINDNGGTGTVSSFPLFINGVSVNSGTTNNFSFSNNSVPFTVSESGNAGYSQSFSGDCDANGLVFLDPAENAFCIITNNDIGAPVVVPPVPPLIDVVKVPSPLALPLGPGPVTYTYTARNPGTVPLTNVTLVGDTCSPIVRVSGDTDGDNQLDVNEAWVHTCTTTLTETHTNTVVATGWANGLSASDIASATVVVGIPLVPPLIHVTKIPSPLTFLAGGGTVKYTERVTNPGTVPLNNVQLTDDKCSPMTRISGDANGDSLLDPSETWTYTCSSNLTQTTTNTATAVGQANGFTVRDFAIATVVVAAAVPVLPSTGFGGESSLVLWALLAAVAALSLGTVGKRVYNSKR